MRHLVKRLGLLAILVPSLCFGFTADSVTIKQGMTPGNPLSTNSGGTVISVTPIPTATPFSVNTPTPVPTATPQPTATPANTPVPTATVVPTATPQPTATLVPTATPIPAVATPTPLTFGTNGTIATFAATELGSYAGSACPTPGVATTLSGSGVLGCATPVPTATVVPTATPVNTPVPTATIVPTATPQPTATPGSGGGAKQIIVAYSSNNLATGATNYIGLSGVWSASGTVAYGVVPIVGTFKNMVCGMTGSFTAQTGTKSYTATLSSIAADTALTCTIAVGSTCSTLSNNYFGTAVCCEDTTHTVTVPSPASNSTLYYYKFVPANTPNANPVTCSIEFDPS